jgi:N-acetylglutamate synthase-like GNAT family acetyltransferase
VAAVRRLTPADAPACDAIIAALPYFFRDPVGVEFAAQDVRVNAGWVCEDDGRVTGFLSLSWSTAEAAEIAWMAVHPDFRRGGRGRLLVDIAADYARAQGASMLFLFTSPLADAPEVSDGYEGTRRFYASLGFVPLWTVRPEGWTEAHLLMVRAL